ncbi:MAG: tetratricopeptide repeat protein [bacterium]
MLSNLAAAYAGQGKVDDAIATYWKALDLKPTDGVLRTALCQTLAAAGRTEVALRECIRATSGRAEGYPPAFDQKGDMLRRLGKNDDAIAAYRKAFELAPEGVSRKRSVAS